MFDHIVYFKENMVVRLRTILSGTTRVSYIDFRSPRLLFDSLTLQYASSVDTFVGRWRLEESESRARE